MISLSDLKPKDGALRACKRVGRGRASGHGKTSTRGHNGQGQRSGESRRFGFEGGQTPMFRRFPKIHNFDQVIKRKWQTVNVQMLNIIEAGSEVTPQLLKDMGILKKATDSLRILGKGDLKVALKIKAHHVSSAAAAKITASGGQVEILNAKPVDSQ